VSQNVLLFLYGTPNLVGSLLGLSGLGLYFGGIINCYWLFIVVGLYVAGVLLTPKRPAAHFTLQQDLAAEDIRETLENLIKRVRRKVPKEVLVKIEHIKESIFIILPKLDAFPGGAQSAYIVRQTALEFLPEALQHFLNLPPAFANVHPLKDGKTAKTLLLEQLDLLATTMEQMVEDAHRSDAEKLLVHGRFLEERFRKVDVLSV